MTPTEITSMKNILTLRYDPTITTHLPKKNWQDFVVTSDSYSTDHIESLIEGAIKSFAENSPSNRYSVALSGGIDSTLALALLRKTLPDAKINAISVRFADSVDESDTARKIASHFDADIQVVNIERYLAEMPKAINVIKMPFWDIHWFYVVREASQSSEILVSGDGGDELFGGYTFRYEKFLSNYIPGSSALEKTKLYLDCHQRDWVPDQGRMFGKKAEFAWDDIYRYITPYFDNALSPLNQVFLADFNGKLLYNWIPLNTSIHEHFGVRSLSPILSDGLITYATHLSPKAKYDEEKKIGKIPLRELLNRYVPKELISTSKHGFSISTVNLWKSSAEGICERFLVNGRVVEDGWIDGKWVQEKLLKLKAEQDVRYVNKFLGLLAFEIWYRLFVTKEMSPDFILE
jgi:asparagine synthase (glutamine-hydrolysing)